MCLKCDGVNAISIMDQSSYPYNRITAEKLVPNLFYYNAHVENIVKLNLHENMFKKLDGQQVPCLPLILLLQMSFQFSLININILVVSRKFIYNCLLFY